MDNINVILVNGDLQLNQSENKGADLRKSSPFWDSFQTQLGKRFADLVWLLALMGLIMLL